MLDTGAGTYDWTGYAATDLFADDVVLGVSVGSPQEVDVDLLYVLQADPRANDVTFDPSR